MKITKKGLRLPKGTKADLVLVGHKLSAMKRVSLFSRSHGEVGREELRIRTGKSLVRNSTEGPQT